MIAVLLLVAILAICHVPVGGWMARVFTSTRHLAVERVLYRAIGVDPEAEQSARGYGLAVLGFSLGSVLLLYLLQRLQGLLPLAWGHGAVDPLVAFNTAASFTTNTNWQSYSPEHTLGELVQALGLTVQNVVSAAVGICVAIVLVRGFARTRSATVGSFWVDLTRCCLRILLPGALIGALLLMLGGVIQTLTPVTTVTTLTGQTQRIPGGLVASQEAIKLLGTNGGGFFNANSSHPFENPSALTNVLECALMLVIPFSLPFTFGTMIGDRRQGLSILAVMGILWTASFALLTWAETAAHGTAPQLAGGAMEGKEARFGIWGTTMFATTSTGTSTGAVNGMHDSFTGLGGMLTMLNMQLGEVSPGGVGTGLYGILILAIITVFIGGLLVGRTPEYLGKKIGPSEMKLASLSVLTMPILVLTGTGLSFALPGVKEQVAAALNNPGGHGLSEVLYAFTSASNNNGSAFAGLNANTPFFNVALGLAMLLGRFLPMLFVVALAGKLAAKEVVATNRGTLRTHTPLFAGVMAGIALIVTGLSFLPTLALGPLAEGLMK